MGQTRARGDDCQNRDDVGKAAIALLIAHAAC
jgi:hypothetical protein